MSHSVSSSTHERARTSALIFICSLALYVATLAPTVEWGDFGGFQTRVSLGELELHPFGHPLWNLLARPFVWFVPFGDAAYRVNLSSACFASLVLVVFYWGALRVTQSRVASLLSVLALGLSHTFWTYAVVPKAYSLTLLIMALCVLLLHQWREQQTTWRILASGVLLGLGTMNHLIILTAAPGFAFFMLVNSRRRVRDALIIIAGYLLGLSPYIYLLGTAPSKGAITGAMIGGTLLNFVASLATPQTLLVGLGFTLVNLSYQFLLLTPVCVWGWWLLFQRDRALALMLLLIFSGDVAFVIVPTQPPIMQLWHLYHPAYLAFSYALAFGLRGGLTRWGDHARQRLAWSSAIVLPILLVYFALAPSTARALGLTERLGVRDFPGRDTVSFLFIPSKAGDDSARQYGERVFAALPPDAVLFADWTPYAALWYLHGVEGLRPDVTLSELPSDEPLLNAVNRYAGRPVFLADVSRYYDLRSVQTAYRIEPAGPAYRLIPLKAR